MTTKVLPMFLAGIVVFGIVGCSNKKPTTMAAPKLRSTVCQVRAFGATGDGKTKDTAAFQKALDFAAAAGGGDVIVPAGDYLIGSIVIGSHTTLHLDKGATLTGSPDKDDYPLIQIRWEGRMREGHRALIHAENAEDVAIRGAGKLVGNAPLGHLRNPRGPCMIEFLKCRGVHLEDFSVQYERMWAIHPTFCRDVVVRNLTIRSTLANGDGIDVDSCQHVRIENCDIDTGDDAIALKSGRGQEAVDIARPTEDVYIADCKLGSAFAGLALGTEMSGGLRKIRVERCVFTRGSNSIFIKSRTGRAGYMEDIEGKDLEAHANAFLRIDLITKGIADEVSATGPARMPRVGNIRFSNVKVDVPFLVDAVVIAEEKPLEGLSLTNITGAARRGIELANMNHVELKNIDVKVQTGPLLRIANVKGTGLEGAEKLEPRPPATSRAARTRPATAGSAATEPAAPPATIPAPTVPPATVPAATDGATTTPAAPIPPSSTMMP